MVLARSLLLLFSTALANAQDAYPTDGPGYDSYYRGEGGALNPDEALNDVVYGDEIPGEPGIDYPVLTEVPRTGFNCGLQAFPGYYADPATGCQAFYVCTGSGRGTGFLCPNGTIFNQETLVCDWWYNFDCNTAVSFYGVNADTTRAMIAATAAAKARGLGVLPPGSLLPGRLAAVAGRALAPLGFGAPGARRPLATPGRLSSPRPVYGPPTPGGYRNNVGAGGGRNDFGRGYNNAPSPVSGGNYNNQNRPSNNNDGYNRPSNYNNQNRPSNNDGYNRPSNYNNQNRPSNNDGYNRPSNYNDGYNRPSNFDNSYSAGGPGSSYRPSSGGDQPGASSPDRQYLPPY